MKGDQLTDLFDPSTPETVTTVLDENVLETLVGDGKKFKDAEALAKGKLESDRHIQQIQRENAAIRERLKGLEDELQERVTLQDFIEEIRQTPLQRNDGTPPVQPHQEVTPSPTPVDIKKMIDEELQQQQRRKQITENVSAVKAELTKTWGKDFSQKLSERAKELNLSQEFLGSVAETSPKAFLELVGAKPRQANPEQDVPPRTSINTGLNLESSGVRNQAYYDKLKKADPNFHKNERLVAQMHRDAQRMGESFFS